MSWIGGFSKVVAIDTAVFCRYKRDVIFECDMDTMARGTILLYLLTMHEIPPKPSTPSARKAAP